MSRITLQAGEMTHEITLLPDGRVAVPGAGNLVVTPLGQGEYRVGAADRTVTVFVARDGDRMWVFVEGRTYEVTGAAGAGRRRTRGHHHETLAAPMPATVTRIAVAPGSAVQAGEMLLVLEAMKMELPLRAPVDGTVQAIHCREGDLVAPGVPLVEIE
jgi:biotin carboxyl carrier protein